MALFVPAGWAAPLTITSFNFDILPADLIVTGSGLDKHIARRARLAGRWTCGWVQHRDGERRIQRLGFLFQRQFAGDALLPWSLGLMERN